MANVKALSLVACLLVASLLSCGRRESDLGGGWFLRVTSSGIPDSGGYHRHLLRGSFLSRQVVARNIADYKRYGRECIIFQPITVEVQFLAACGSNGPRLVAVGERQGSWVLGADGLEQTLGTENGEEGVVATVAVIGEAAIQKFLTTAESARAESRKMVGSGEVESGVEVVFLKKPVNRKELDAQDENGQSRLARACKADDVVAVAALLKAGADPNIRDRNGNTPLTFVAQKPDFVQALVTAGADVNAESRSGNFPLKEAVSPNHCQGRVESCVVAVKLLLSAGADPGHRNRFGDFAETYASTDELRELLREARLKNERASGARGKSD